VIRRRLAGSVWVVIYVILSALPLLVLLVGETPSGRELWREISVGLGFAGLALIALQFALTGRFRVIKAPFGSDIVYHFHRQISIVAFALILAHPVILFVGAPNNLRLLNVFSAPGRAKLGVLAVVFLLAIIVLSLWRRNLGIEYRLWRVSHGVLATLAIAFALGHVLLVDHYVGTPWKRTLWIIYICGWVGILLWTRILDPVLMLRRPYRIKEVRPERGDTWSVVVEPDGHPGFRFGPGQFAWLSVRNSPFADADHPFSFSSSAECPSIYEFGIRELGDFTRQVKTLRPGEKVYLDGPFGAFSIDRYPDALGYIFIAGGIGITPIISMLRTLADRGDKRPLLLLYANRDPDRIAYYEDLEQLAAKLSLRVVHVLSRSPVHWDGERGRIDTVLLRRYLHDIYEGREVFVCGPDGLIDAVEDHLSDLGLHLRNVHSERFNLV